MEQYQDLYLAENTKALDALAVRTVSENNPFQNRKIALVCKFLESLYREAQKTPLDQEKTYIFLKRFFILHDRFLELEKDEKFFELRFGPYYKKAKAQFQAVSDSLTKRYDLAYGNTTKTMNENKDNLAEKSSDSDLEGKIFNNQFITCIEFYRALKKNYYILIVDARPSYDYKNSHLNLDLGVSINVPDECLKAGLSANVLGTFLSPETLQIWNQRDTFDVIVLFDWNTTSENIKSSKLEFLYSAIVEWDCNKNYKEKPTILSGGYLELLLVYPSLCTNPMVVLSKRNTELDDLLNIDDIVYPTEFDTKTNALESLDLSASEISESNKLDVAGAVLPLDEETTILVVNDNDDEAASTSSVGTKPKTSLSPSIRPIIPPKPKYIEEQIDLLKEHKQLSTSIQDTINELLKKEEQWKRNNELLSTEKNNKSQTLLERNEKDIVNDITKFIIQLKNLNERKDKLKNKIDAYSLKDQHALKTEQINEIIELEKDYNEKMRLINAIAAERNEILKRARALKPKSLLQQQQNQMNQQNLIQNERKSETERPVIDRATKPKVDNYKIYLDKMNEFGDGMAGLQNIKNTCYMNTIIQCLRNIPLIQLLFCNGIYKRHGVREPAAIVDETAYIIRLLSEKEVHYIRPTDFYRKVITLEPSYGSGDHEDAMEFFLFLFNHLHEDCAYDLSRVSIMTPSQNSWYTQLQGKTSVFAKLFFHQIRITQKCQTCLQQQNSYKFEIENSFMLSVPEYPFQLENLMKEYMDDYEMSEYICKNCKKPVLNVKDVMQQPKILVIILKRYKQVQHRHCVVLQKNDAEVIFPKDHFIFGKCIYKLYSIVMHNGDMQHGHYRAACLTKNGWFEFNDSFVEAVNIDKEIIRREACAFFYALSNKNGCDLRVLDTL